MPNFGQAVRLNKIPVIGLVPETSGTAPVSPRAGQLWVDTTETPARLKVYDSGSTSWVPFDLARAVADGVVTTAALADGAVTNAKLAGNISLGKLAVNPLDRANHTGTQGVASLSDFASSVRAVPLTEFASPTSALSMSGNRLIDLADPTSAQDAATRSWTEARIAALVDSAPAVLDTLNELSRALGDDPNFATTVSNRIGTVESRISGLEVSTAQKGFSTNLPAIAAGSTATVTHNLGTQDVIAQVRNTATNEVEYVGVTMSSANTVSVSVDMDYAAGALRISILPAA